MLGDGTLRGIGFFAAEVIGLISDGKTETISEIEKHFEQSDLVEYIFEKYEQDFTNKFDNSTYDNKKINEYFYNYIGYVNGNEGRKYGIRHQDDGLLLILALLADGIERTSLYWKTDN